jgi:hypothetical protein
MKTADGIFYLSCVLGSGVGTVGGVQVHGWAHEVVGKGVWTQRVVTGVGIWEGTELGRREAQKCRRGGQRDGHMGGHRIIGREKSLWVGTGVNSTMVGREQCSEVGK